MDLDTLSARRDQYQEEGLTRRVYANSNEAHARHNSAQLTVIHREASLLFDLVAELNQRIRVWPNLEES